MMRLSCLILYLGGGALEVGNEVLTVTGRLDTGEDHLGALDVVLGRQEVLKESVLPPGDAGVLVGGGVGVVLRLARLATEEAVQVGALLVSASLFILSGCVYVGKLGVRIRVCINIESLCSASLRHNNSPHLSMPASLRYTIHIHWPSRRCGIESTWSWKS